MKKLIQFFGIMLISVGLQAQPCIPNPSSLDFNGTSSAVTVSGSTGLDMTTACTVEAWVWARQWAASYTAGTIFCKHRWDNTTYGYVLRAGGSGQLSFNIAGAVGGSPVSWKEVLSPINIFPLQTWTHVAGTFDGNVLSLYVNGVLVADTAFSGTIVPSTGLRPRIGQLSDSTYGMSRRWNGLIDEVRVWNRALSQAEIQARMNDHIDPSIQTGLVGYWRFNENSGFNLADLGTGNNHAGIFGATWTTNVPFSTSVPATPVITYVSGHLHSSATTGNQWYLGTTLINGATQQNYTPTQYGIYYVKVTENGCVANSLPFNYNTTGLDALADKDFELGPNPAHETMYFKPGTKNGGFHDYFILDLVGNKLMTGAIQPSGETRISISGLKPGIYLIRIHGDSGSVTRKFVIE